MRCGNLPRMSLKHSPLHDRHVALGAKFAEFGGWEMPLEYTHRRAQGARRGPRRRRASSTSATSASSSSAATGAVDVPQRLPDQRPRPDRTRPGAVHPGLRRGDRRRRRRPDRLPSTPTTTCCSSPTPPTPPRCGAGSRPSSPDGRHDHRPARDPRRAGGAGHRSPTRCSSALGLPVGHDYMSFAEASFDGQRGGGLPHRLHRRARLRADRRRTPWRRRSGTPC